MAVTAALDLTPRQLDTVRALLARCLPDTGAWVYGSRARWTSRPESDLDLVVFAEPGQARAVSDLRKAFDESDLPFRVDLFVWDEVPDAFRQEIKREHVVLLGGPSVLERYGAVDPVRRSPDETWRHMAFTEAVVVNPAVRLERGLTYPFVDMAAVTAGSRCAHAMDHRTYSGGGSRFQDGDTLMARITPCLENGKIARYCADRSSESAHGSTEFIVVRGRAGVTDSGYAYYLTQWKELRSYAVDQMTGTSGRQRVPVNSLSHVSVPVPPLPEQRAIARVLGALDDKIELNRRMNETLEATARAIFRDWFVDFGPVRAKMEGREPYLPPGIWRLFPDSYNDDGIPAQWRFRTVRECFHLTMGQSPPGSTYNDNGEGLPFFQGRMDFGFRYPKNRRYCTAPKRIAKCDDTLVSVRAPVGDINMAWEECCAGRGVAALRHNSGARSFTYYSAWAIQQDLKQYEQTGTVFGAINKKQFEAQKVMEPTPRLVELFEYHAAPLDDRIRKNVAESQALEQTRDLLLPKLISGEMRLPDVERAVKAVA